MMGKLGDLRLFLAVAATEPVRGGETALRLTATLGAYGAVGKDHAKRCYL